MAGIQLTSLKTNCGAVGLCDSKMFRWVLSGDEGCKQCLSMTLNYWEIPVDAPLSWVNDPLNCLDGKVLTLDVDALRDILDLPEDFYQPYSYFKQESDVRSIAYTQELTFTRNFPTDKESEISIDSHLTVSGTTTNNISVRVRLEVNSVVVDESYIDFSDQDLRHNIHVMWAGNLPANVNNSIVVKIRNMPTPGIDSPSIRLTDYKIKYLGIKKI